MKTEIKNAKITSTMLGFEDHDMLTFMIQVDFDKNSSQGFGGYQLGGKSTTGLVYKLLKAVGVRRWEDLKGTVVRVKQRDGLLVAMGNILEDSWFVPEEDLKI